MYLLNRYPHKLQSPAEVHLHSTMYLLNPFSTQIEHIHSTDLHSTMYLLNRGQHSIIAVWIAVIYIPLCIY